MAHYYLQLAYLGHYNTLNLRLQQLLDFSIIIQWINNKIPPIPVFFRQYLAIENR